MKDLNAAKKSPREIAIIICSVLFLGFQFYRTFIRPLPPMIQNPLHVVLLCYLMFLYKPIVPKGETSWKKYLMIIDYLVLILTPLLIYYFLSQSGRLMARIQYLDPLMMADYVVCFGLIFVILEGIRRVLGPVLAIFISIFIAYAWLGPVLPGIFRYGGTTLAKFTDLMVLGNGGIFGSSVSASANFMFWFLIFGELFSKGGGGQVLIDLGMSLGSKAKDNSGPAKAAVLASGLMGMVSGSAVANVSGTGVITIPLMKKVGYEPEEAGAIEAVASTGGQIMPPIMGVGAFLMAELLGIQYITVALGAAIPSIVYYGAAFLLVTLLAKKRASQGQKVNTHIETPPILPRLYQLLPMVVLIYFIATGATIQQSALYGIAAVLIISSIKKETRFTPRSMFNSLMDAAKRTATVTLPCAGCGIIIGTVVSSGLSNRLSNTISLIGGNSLWVGLIITMLGCMILGMALPTVAAYLTAYVLFLPTLTRLGIEMFPANMFIFYFGIFAQITPPVCVASFTAAGIAGGNAWKTGWKGFVYASVAFLVPYVFVYKPAILLMGTFWEIVSATAVLALGTAMLTIGVSGYVLRKLDGWERILFALAGVMIVLPETISTYGGMALAACMLVIQIIRSKKEKTKVCFATGVADADIVMDEPKQEETNAGEN